MECGMIRNEIYEKQFYEHYLTNKQVNANTEIADYSKQHYHN